MINSLGKFSKDFLLAFVNILKNIIPVFTGSVRGQKKTVLSQTTIKNATYLPSHTFSLLGGFSANHLMSTS